MMANKIKGEVALMHGGKSYTLVLDFNALADFEAEAGVANALVSLQNIAAMSATHTRALFWAGLKQHHPEITLADAGAILSANLDKMGEAMAAAFPDAGPPAGNVAGARRRGKTRP